MKYRLAFSLFYLCLSGLVQAADIQTSEGRGLERDRIGRERAALEKTFDAQNRECQTRFVVTSCLDEVKVRRFRAFDELTRQENVLNAIDRKEAAAKQQQKLDDKTSDTALAEKEKKRLEALETSAKRESEREEKRQERAQKTAMDKGVREHGKSNALTSEEKTTKRAAYEAKQKDLAERIKRRDDGLRDLAEKQKERERDEARKAEKYAKALEAQTKLKEAK